MQGVIKGKTPRPRRVLLYGTHGIGKSTWAARAPSPLVIATEDGLDDVGVDRTPLLRDTQSVARWLIELGGDEEHGYRTVVIDTLDWLERLIWQSVAKDGGKQSIEEYGYGKGYVLALKKWEQLLLMLDCCRNKRMNVILLAHAKVERFSPPDSDPYDRWQPDLHKLAAPVVQEWCDEVLFAKYKVSTIQREDGFGTKRTRAVGSGDRVVYTCETPTHAAKRRIDMPDEIELDWAAYEQCWPQGGNVAGIVKDGHSKPKKEKVTNG